MDLPCFLVMGQQLPQFLFLLSSQKYIAAGVTFSSSQENQIVNEFYVFGQASRVFSAIHSN